jgi:RNA 2',3'-cyclic 3'-phosphodiesterase
MRLFVGIHLPDSVKRAAGVAADDLRTRLAGAAPDAAFRWVDPGNLHLTIWFLGEVGDARVRALAAALEPPLRTAPFTLAFRGAGIFPQRGRPRAVWFGLRSGREPLLSIHDQLRTRLIRCGVEPERRPYSPHLTVARVKDVRRQDLPAVRRVVAETVADAGKCVVGAVTLFRSLLSPEGSRYESVLRVPLE